MPGLFGGSDKKSEEHLRKSLTYGDNSTVSHFFLAETLFDLDRDKEAIDELKKVLAVPTDPDWEPEDREVQAEGHRAAQAEEVGRAPSAPAAARSGSAHVTRCAAALFAPQTSACWAARSDMLNSTDSLDA